jgi:hypothetical protein
MYAERRASLGVRLAAKLEHCSSGKDWWKDFDFTVEAGGGGGGGEGGGERRGPCSMRSVMYRVVVYVCTCVCRAQAVE